MDALLARFNCSRVLESNHQSIGTETYACVGVKFVSKELSCIHYRNLDSEERRNFLGVRKDLLRCQSRSK